MEATTLELRVSHIDIPVGVTARHAVGLARALEFHATCGLRTAIIHQSAERTIKYAASSNQPSRLSEIAV